MAVEIDTHGNPRRGNKSAAAFRTISEVADDLEVPPHVLRFWETKFAQVRPLKRGGGRRYYRPEDVALLKRIRELLYSDGYTIKGVQRLLRDGAVKPRASNEDISEAPVQMVAEADPDSGGNDQLTGGLDERARGEIAEVLDELIALKRKLAAARQ